MKILLQFTSLFILTSITYFSHSGSISDSFLQGDTLTAEHMNNANDAVNDNNSRISSNHSSIIQNSDLIDQNLSSINQITTTLNTLISAVEALNSKGIPRLKSDNYYSTRKNVFNKNDGDVIINPSGNIDARLNITYLAIN